MHAKPWTIQKKKISRKKRCEEADRMYNRVLFFNFPRHAFLASLLCCCSCSCSCCISFLCSSRCKSCTRRSSIWGLGRPGEAPPSTAAVALAADDAEGCGGAFCSWSTTRCRRASWSLTIAFTAAARRSSSSSLCLTTARSSASISLRRATSCSCVFLLRPCSSALCAVIEVGGGHWIR